MNDTFKPSLFDRVFQGFLPIKEKEVPSVIPASSVIQLSALQALPEQEGGKMLPKITMDSEGSAFMKRAFMWLLVFMISLYIAAKITGSGIITNIMFREDNPSANFDTTDIVFKERFKLTMRYLLLYITILTIVIVLILSFVCTLVALFVGARAKDMRSALEDISNAISNMFWTYTIDGSTYTMKTMISYLAMSIFGMYIIFLIYFSLAKGYLTNMYYPDYVDTEKSTAPEHTQPTKFILNYSLLMMFILAFMLGNYMFHNISNKSEMAFNMFMLIIYVVLYTLLISFELCKNYVLMILAFVIMIVIGILPSILL